MDSGIAVKRKLYKSGDNPSARKPVQGFGYAYLILVCYEGYNKELDFDEDGQDQEAYELFEVYDNDDFYDGD